MNGKRQHRQKRNLGGATRRTLPSTSASLLVDKGWIVGRTLDFGSGFGDDARHFQWETYDPHYGPYLLRENAYDTVVCVNVLDVISAPHRRDAIDNLQFVLKDTGAAYVVVSRAVPVHGRTCAMKRRQYRVVLAGAESVHTDKKREVYKVRKGDTIRDQTKGRF